MDIRAKHLTLAAASGLLLAAAVRLDSSAAEPAQSAAPAKSATFGHWDQLDWKPSATLPPGHDYHLIWDDPASGGIQALVRLAKGSALPAHTHDCQETLILLSGKLRIKSGTEEHVLSTGDFTVIPAGVVHEFRVEGRKEAVMALITNGPFGAKPVPKTP